MFDSADEMLKLADHDGSATCSHGHPVTANSHTCDVCGYVNWCVYEQGHSGLCLCDKGHRWQGSH